MGQEELADLRAENERLKQALQQSEQANDELFALNYRMRTPYDISHDIGEVRDIKKLLHMALSIMRGVVGSTSGIAVFWDLETKQPLIVSSGVHATAKVKQLDLTPDDFEVGEDELWLMLRMSASNQFRNKLTVDTLEVDKKLAHGNITIKVLFVNTTKRSKEVTYCRPPTFSSVRAC